jgi:phospholipase C
MFHPHTDMHPHSGVKWAEDLGLRPPDSMIGGESLLADVYNAVRTSSSAGGSNWSNTLLLVTFDEHGGTYDHVPPPAAVPPDASSPEQGFRFDRMGVRIPSILISAWADAPVVTDRYQSTSMISSFREWWGLGDPLTQRDAVAPSLVPLLSRPRPRPPEEWPTVHPRKPGILERLEVEFLRLVEALESPMEKFERDILGDALAQEAAASGGAIAVDPTRVTHAEAHQHFNRVGTTCFPNVASGRAR